MASVRCSESPRRCFLLHPSLPWQPPHRLELDNGTELIEGFLFISCCVCLVYHVWLFSGWWELSCCGFRTEPAGGVAGIGAKILWKAFACFPYCQLFIYSNYNCWAVACMLMCNVVQIQVICQQIWNPLLIICIPVTGFTDHWQNDETWAMTNVWVKAWNQNYQKVLLKDFLQPFLNIPCQLYKSYAE